MLWSKMAVTTRFLSPVIFYIIGISSILPYKTEQLDKFKLPTVMISILVRNKEHTLPYFLTYLSRLDYPKDRISLWLRSDHNIDDSVEVIERWLKIHGSEYHSVDSLLISSSDKIDGEEGVAHWPPSRYSHIIYLREEALKAARLKWCTFLWVLDCDVFITNPNTLRKLVFKNRDIVAPMLRSDGLYSNFWCGMTNDYYYLRTDEYAPILNRKNKGCHIVPMVYSSVLIDLRLTASDFLSYDSSQLRNYAGPHDDIITFARSANLSGISMSVCNDEIYGYVMVPLEKDDQISYDYLQLRNLKLEILVDGPPLEVDDYLSSFVKDPKEGRLNVDKVFMINLKRRPDRRERMLESLKELHLEATIVDAVDGQLLNDNVLEKLGIKLMPGYKDPYHKRPMKVGEIGCFLSHYGIWKEVLEMGYEIVMVLEDDVRFEPFFNQKMHSLLEEIKRLSFKWDLVYLGRKRLEERSEELVDGSRYLVWAGYSYWTLGYLLSQTGAEKLLAQNPLENILPVDEYLPILYDKHPEEEWKEFYPIRDLVALSAEPLVLYPARYLHEEGYISDTEDSPTITTPNPEL